MKNYWKTACAAAIIMHLSVSILYPHSGPFDGQTFKGRIAYSADGNYNDEDDWGASPVALAIFAQFGVKDKLVHFDYNCILPKTDPKWEKIHQTSVLGAARRYGYSKSLFYDCQKDRDGAIENIKNAINESSADNPLYFILAGPMEVPYLGIQKSDPAKRQFVYCISHSRWNDGYTTQDGNLMTHNKRDVIPQGIKWVQITDQNQFLSTSRYGSPAKSQDWQPWYWMRDSDDPNVRFLWERLLAVTRADCSDSGMAYFLMTGDERSEISKLRKLLDDNIVPAPTDPREYIRIEAENFLKLENYDLEHRNDRKVSHRINLKLASMTTGRIRTRFEQPYTANKALYNVDIRYLDEKDGRCRLSLFLNGRQNGSSWYASKDNDQWTTHTIEDVTISAGDEIMVEVQGDAGEYGKLDYVQLNLTSLATEVTGSSSPFSAGDPLDDPDARSLFSRKIPCTGRR